MTFYTIIEDGVRIGTFSSEKDRDIAFDEHFAKSKRFGIKGVLE